MQSSNCPDTQQEPGTLINPENLLLEKSPVFEQFLYQFKYGSLTAILAKNGIESEDIIFIVGNDASKFLKMLANRFRSAKLLHNHFREKNFSDFCKRYFGDKTESTLDTIVIAKPLLIILFQQLKKEDKAFYETMLTNEFPVTSNEYKYLVALMSASSYQKWSFFNICKTIADNTKKLAENMPVESSSFDVKGPNIIETTTLAAPSVSTTHRFIHSETRFDITQFIRDNLKSDTSLPENISFSVVFMPSNLHDKYRSLTYKIYRMGDINKELTKSIPSFRKFLNRNDILYMIIIDQAFRPYEGPNQSFTNPVKMISQFPDEEAILKEILIATKYFSKSRSLEKLLTELVHSAATFSKDLLMSDLVQISNSSKLRVILPNIRPHMLLFDSNSHKRKVYSEAEQPGNVKKTKSYDVPQLVAASTLVLFSEKPIETDKSAQSIHLEVPARHLTQ